MVTYLYNFCFVLSTRILKLEDYKYVMFTSATPRFCDYLQNGNDAEHIYNLRANALVVCSCSVRLINSSTLSLILNRLCQEILSCEFGVYTN